MAEKIITEVRREEDKNNDYKFTCNPNEIIFTKDLIYCIGLGLVDEVNNVRKRGLMHILYNDEVVFEKNENSKYVYDGDHVKVPDNVLERTNVALEQFLYNFKKEGGQNIFIHPKAVSVFKRTIYSNKIQGFENPLAEYVLKWLNNNHIPILGVDGRGGEISNLDKIIGEDITKIHHKDFGFHNSKIVIILYNRMGKIMNFNKTNIPYDIITR